MIPMLANVSFGILAFTPAGWAFMVAIIVLEILIISRRLSRVWWHRKSAMVVVTANVISGVIGIALSLLLNGGWWLVVWMPWVSSQEVQLPRHLLAISVFYVVAFVLSIAIEGAVGQLMLKSQFAKPQIWRAFLTANMASYLVGSIALYSYSFALWRYL
ncbi:MAG: hypothetical protein AAFO87_02975 [Cyanobacteria bacterium J06607_6]